MTGPISSASSASISNSETKVDPWCPSRDLTTTPRFGNVDAASASVGSLMGGKTARGSGGLPSGSNLAKRLNRSMLLKLGNVTAERTGGFVGLGRRVPGTKGPRLSGDAKRGAKWGRGTCPTLEMGTSLVRLICRRSESGGGRGRASFCGVRRLSFGSPALVARVVMRPMRGCPSCIFSWDRVRLLEPLCAFSTQASILPSTRLGRRRVRTGFKCVPRVHCAVSSPTCIKSVCTPHCACSPIH